VILWTWAKHSLSSTQHVSWTKCAERFQGKFSVCQNGSPSPPPPIKLLQLTTTNSQWSIRFSAVFSKIFLSNKLSPSSFGLEAVTMVGGLSPMRKKTVRRAWLCCFENLVSCRWLLCLLSWKALDNGLDVYVLKKLFWRRSLLFVFNRSLVELQTLAFLNALLLGYRCNLLGFLHWDTALRRTFTCAQGLERLSVLRRCRTWLTVLYCHVRRALPVEKPWLSWFERSLLKIFTPRWFSIAPLAIWTDGVW